MAQRDDALKLHRNRTDTDEAMYTSATVIDQLVELCLTDSQPPI
ncbi:MAG: hypothetical protein ACYS83_00415 [Planctomycetota bacterium]